ncbi:anthocyanidin 5,3-O-glucosyltransferase-like [Hordeum vulgare subsp. vulgare]|uniref:Glycosyltransferase n=1 Tax=Hordeum vulgare subsp. vulgare TaxID=112509 RepID=A0A8I6XU36_HORVV|nr:anthocyanidin 5,3-O-glucosyltransferase-like [Hordeum vulgare subsp. vulgare]
MTAQNGHADPAKKPVVVIYAPPGMAGHLVPTVELGKLLLAQGLRVTVLLGGGDTSFLDGLAAANPALAFHCLPPAALAPEVAAACGSSFEARVFELARASNPDLRDFLRSARPAALLIDFFCSAALDVGAELAVPTYFFLTTCIASVALCLYQPVIHEGTTLSFREMGGDPVRAPGLPPIPADHLAAAVLDRESLSNRHFLELSQRMCDSRGVLVNSCRSLEPRAVNAIVSGLCTPPGHPTPPLYCIGPLIKPDEETGTTKRHECLAWLDGQPEASVVFLCFGSMGRFSAKQVKEMAAGLEASGQRFLWIVRRPPQPGAERRPPAEGEDDVDDLDALFPAGFLERTKGRGLVITSWAPQRQVLAHAAVGGFVTHCGWNSVLEAVAAGVPMLAWPLYAEQRMNRVFLVDEMRLAVPMEGYDKEMVESSEVAAKVRWLIESDGGRELRQRTRAAMGRAEEALGNGGESSAALADLATQWKKSAGDDDS